MKTLLKVSTALLLATLSTCTTSPSYASKSKGFVFNPVPSLDLVAVGGNNPSQETRKLLKPVQHHTIVDVFLCLSFVSLPFMGELRLALAITSLWQGGRGNKPFMGEYRVPLGFSGFLASLPPYFWGNHQNLLPLEQV